MAKILRFSKTMKEIERRLKKKYPKAVPIRNATNDRNHTLWMLKQIPKLDSQRKVIAWYNWILSKAHSMKLIDKRDPEITEIRNMARGDARRLKKSAKRFISAIINFDELETLR